MADRVQITENGAAMASFSGGLCFGLNFFFSKSDFSSNLFLFYANNAYFSQAKVMRASGLEYASSPAFSLVCLRIVIIAHVKVA